MGPHYAREQHLESDNVIYLDRCHYGNTSNRVSIGLQNKQGGRDFIAGSGRKGLTIKENNGTKSLFLADYNGIVESADIVRLHPQNEESSTTLANDILQCNYATGYETTSLIEAALSGLVINCKGTKSILLQSNWLELLPYANWDIDEIGSGELWHHLKSSHNQLANL